MIVDNIENAYLYCKLDEKIAVALEFLKNTELHKLDIGKYEIDGDKIFALVQEYTTKSRNDSLWEAHRQYIDIQYVIQGEELIGYTNIENLVPKIEYNESKDIIFLEGQGDFLTVKPGIFTVFMPQDAHMPSIFDENPIPVKKIVIKIKIN